MRFKVTITWQERGKAKQRKSATVKAEDISEVFSDDSEAVEDAGLLKDVPQDPKKVTYMAFEVRKV